MSSVLLLLMVIDVAVVVVVVVGLVLTCPFRGASTPHFIYKGGEVIRKVTESVTT
jgi:hypothetical protein